MSFKFRWLKFYWDCRHFISGIKRYYVKIPKKYKGPFVNITILPSDDCGSTYDPTEILLEFIRELDDGSLPGRGFTWSRSLLDFTTNLHLEHIHT